MAETLDEDDHVSLLDQTLEEEKETDEKLTELAGQINTQANEIAEKEPTSEPGRKSKQVA